MRLQNIYKITATRKARTVTNPPLGRWIAMWENGYDHAQIHHSIVEKDPGKNPGLAWRA